MFFHSFAHTSFSFSFFSILGANSYENIISTKTQHINEQKITKQFYLKFKTTLHQKFYASIAIYRTTSQPYHYSMFSYYQYANAVQGDEVARVTFPIQIQAHSKKKKTPHHSQSSQLYMTFPIQLELFGIHEH